MIFASSQGQLTCRDENASMKLKAQDDRFECRTNLTLTAWENVGIGKVSNLWKTFKNITIKF